MDAGGSAQTSALSFSAILNGSDTQTITVSANTASGAAQSQAIVLRNDNTGRSGRSLDEALHAINTALQQSNNSTLQQIVAVKDNASGTEKIRFLSTLSSFHVAVGTNGSGTGVGSQGQTSPPASSVRAQPRHQYTGNGPERRDGAVERRQHAR